MCFFSKALFVLLFLSLISISYTQTPEDLYKEVQRIYEASQIDDIGYNRMAYICNMFGERLISSRGLNNTIDYIEQTMIADGFNNVVKQPVSVPNWIPNQHKCRLEMQVINEERFKEMAVTPFGTSVATPEEGITAEVLVVKSFEEFEDPNLDLCTKAKGKIVVWNAVWKGSYGSTVIYRSSGADTASKCGALASLTRSVTPYSLYTPHTGLNTYSGNVPKIPTGGITVEDSELLQYFQDIGKAVSLKLTLLPEDRGTTTSFNIFGEITGSEYPDQVVLIGGHIDSWFLSCGAHDDLGGFMMSWQALKLLQYLNIQPKRTIRAIGWTAEEFGGSRGGNAYFEYAQQQNLNNTIFAFESDTGSFNPEAMNVYGSSETLETMEEIAKLLLPHIDMDIIFSNGPAADVDPFAKAGVPSGGLRVGEFDRGNDVYFLYHHSTADTIDKVNINEFRDCIFSVASIAYVIADMENTLPR
eukprot:TRINITY_DN10689_c0_g1_i1.p1 TRINITY_DN10689_c0_g1~~TRINITY_DN10689_c0_g1_i1.p1  ORF type:complete len:480 (+),score=146.49 TRINITY_DN10689_c0_g1_i1:25-1440(+)